MMYYNFVKQKKSESIIRQKRSDCLKRVISKGSKSLRKFLGQNIRRNFSVFSRKLVFKLLEKTLKDCHIKVRRPFSFMVDK